MPDIRQIILDELERRGWSHYRLAKAVEPHMSNVAVYEFLKGRTQMTADKVGRVFDVLGLVVVQSDGQGAPAKRRPAPKGKGKERSKATS